MMEGISNEACSLAGHWGLGKLIALYDDNRISIDGHTDISFTEDVAKRYEALGWHVIHVINGNTDIDGMRAAIAQAKAVKDKPTLIKVGLCCSFGLHRTVLAHPEQGGALGLCRSFGSPHTRFYLTPALFRFQVVACLRTVSHG